MMTSERIAAIVRDNRIASCARTAWDERRGETHCASPEDKKAAIELERMGLATIRRTDVHCGGFKEWWVRLTPAGVAATNPPGAAPYVAHPARYAKGMLLVRAPGRDGLKSRVARLLEALNCRYTNRERGYICSPSKLRRFEQLYADGWDANYISHDLIAPDPAPAPAPRVKRFEGVDYYPFAVRFRLADGRRRSWIRWSPGFPWVYDEVGRELIDTFGADGIAAGSCVIEPLETLPRAVGVPFRAKRAVVSLSLVREGEAC